MKGKKRKDFYTLQELSVLLGIDECVLRRWCERGEIACIRDVTQTEGEYVVRRQDFKKVAKKVKEWKKERKALSNLLKVFGTVAGVLAWLFFVGGILSESDTIWAMAGIFFLSFVGLMVTSSIISPQKEYRRRKRDDWWERGSRREDEWWSNPMHPAYPHD